MYNMSVSREVKSQWLELTLYKYIYIVTNRCKAGDCTIQIPIDLSSQTHDSEAADDRHNIAMSLYGFYANTSANREDNNGVGDLSHGSFNYSQIGFAVHHHPFRKKQGTKITNPNQLF
jgi:hypothetical protein